MGEYVNEVIIVTETLELVSHLANGQLYMVDNYKDDINLVFTMKRLCVDNKMINYASLDISFTSEDIVNPIPISMIKTNVPRMYVIQIQTSLYSTQ